MTSRSTASLGLILGLLAWGRCQAHPAREPAPKGWWLLQRAAREHGHRGRWDQVRDLRLKLTRSWLDEAGRVKQEEQETQRLLKGRRPRILLETPTERGWRVFGFDGRRSWTTLNGYRLRSERTWADAEERTRRQAFFARLPFILREKDARSTVVGRGFTQGRATVLVQTHFVGGTRPSEETYVAHLDADTYRLLRLDYDNHRTPGSHYRVEFSEYSRIAGILVPFERKWVRSDGITWKHEKVKGVAVNECPPPHLFRNPVQLPDWRAAKNP